MTLNRKQIRHKLYEMFGPDNLGYHSTNSARTTTTMTDRTRWGTYVGTYNEEGRGIYIPTLTSPNDFKRLASIASGVMTIGDLAWSDGGTGPDLYENLRKDVYPDELNDCIRRAVRAVYSQTERPISIWDLPDGTGDGAFDEANTTSWIQGDAGAAPSIAKTTSAAYNLTGYQSLLVTNGAANNYIVHNVDVPVAPGEQLWLGALSILSQGTSVSFIVYDKTNNVQIGTTLTATGNVPYHLGQVYTVPSTCYAVNIRLGAAASNSIVAWDALPGHSLTNKRFATPDWANFGWQINGFGPTRYNYQVSAGIETAQSRKEYGWQRGPTGDWKTENMGENSNPRAIRILKEGQLPACDLWIKGLRQESDHDALTDDTGTTECDEDMLMAACVVEVCTMLANKGDGTKWDDDIKAANAILNAQRTMSYNEPDEAPPSRVMVGRWG